MSIDNESKGRLRLDLEKYFSENLKRYSPEQVLQELSSFDLIYNKGIDDAIEVVKGLNSGNDYSKKVFKEKIISELPKLKNDDRG